MQEIFEKIKERLENEVQYQQQNANIISGNFKVSGKQARLKMGECYEHAIEIVNQVADEYGKDINVPGNDGWIPCSSGKMPENGRRCWVTYEWANGSLHVDKDYLVNGKWFETEDEAVKAWMYNDEETPAPYKPKGWIEWE